MIEVAIMWSTPDPNLHIQTFEDVDEAIRREEPSLSISTIFVNGVDRENFVPAKEILVVEIIAVPVSIRCSWSGAGKLTEVEVEEPCREEPPTLSPPSRALLLEPLLLWLVFLTDTRAPFRTSMRVQLVARMISVSVERESWRGSTWRTLSSKRAATALVALKFCSASKT